MPMRFGLSTHLFHGERLARAHFEAIAAAGFDLVELFATRTHLDYHDARHLDDVRGWLAELGITAGSMHLPICAGFTHGVWGRAFSNASPHTASRQEAVDETIVAIRAAASLGCGVVVLHLGLPRGQEIPPGDNDPGSMKRSLEQIAAAAADQKMTLALEVIPNDLSTPGALLDLLGGESDLGDAAICLDFGHANILGGAPEATEALSGFVVTTHVHDNDARVDDHRVPFEGTIDWIATLMAVSKIGYAGPLVFEVADHGDATAVLARTVGARRHLQGILDDLAAPFDFDRA